MTYRELMDLISAYGSICVKIGRAKLNTPAYVDLDEVRGELYKQISGKVMSLASSPKQFD